MTLLICYECNQEVSSLAERCPHCGAPVKSTGSSNHNDEIVKKINTIATQEPLPGSMVCIDCRSKFVKIHPICPACGSSNRITANPGERMLDTTVPKKIKTNYMKGLKCPACGHDTVQRITAANKVGSALIFGIFSLGHISKTFKCVRCGYKY